MKSVRERFEEIWPVPEGVFWRDSKGRYGCHSVSDVYAMDAHNIRLDTFTRCQETMAPVLSIIDELVADLQYRVLYSAIEDDNERSQVRINQIKKILGA